MSAPLDSWKVLPHRTSTTVDDAVRREIADPHGLVVSHGEPLLADTRGERRRLSESLR